MFYITFIPPNPHIMMLLTKSKILPIGAQLCHMLCHLPDRKSKPVDLCVAVRSRKYARISIKFTHKKPDLSATQIHQGPP